MRRREVRYRERYSIQGLTRGSRDSSDVKVELIVGSLGQLVSEDRLHVHVHEGLIREGEVLEIDGEGGLRGDDSVGG